MVRVLNSLREWKHLTLLVSLLGLIFAQPVAQTGVVGLIVFDVLLTIVTAVIFFVVFERRSTRMAALLLAAPMIGAHWIGRIAGPHNDLVFAIDHAIATLFLGFAVTVVLRGIFQPKKFHADDVLGVVCGYLLAGLAWGNLYNLADAYSPSAFSVRSDVAWQLSTEPSSAICSTISASSRSRATATTKSCRSLKPHRRSPGWKPSSASSTWPWSSPNWSD